MKINRLIPQSVKNYGKHLPTAVLANLLYFFPSRKLQLVGVTGTDGKTTTSWLIYHLLTQAGSKTGLVSTVSAKIGQEEVPTGFHVTSPSPLKLQKFLRQMISAQVKQAVLEVTSHGLDQFRFWGCRFQVGVLTNITHEHLDYHHTFARYLLAKAKLLQKSQKVVLNRDDPSYGRLKKLLKKKTIISYGLGKGGRKADFMAKKIRLGRRGTQFVLETGQKEFLVASPLLGEFNIYNQLAAIAAVTALGVKTEKAVRFLSTFGGVKGRMEAIPNKKGVRVFIDFAHTPNGLENALATLRAIIPRRKKLIVVFGCAGLRDQKKRPIMGEIAARLSDYAVLTAEDPRTEDVREIIRQIAQGCKKRGWRKLAKRKVSRTATRREKGFFVIPNRQEAINFAVRKLARKGDFVVICGKGHEQSMCFGKTEYPWSEHQAVRVALRWRR